MGRSGSIRSCSGIGIAAAYGLVVALLDPDDPEPDAARRFAASELAPVAARHGARVVEADLDAHPEWEERFGERVPLLLAGGAPDGEPLADPFASQILGATWTVNDEFTPGLGGAAQGEAVDQAAADGGGGGA